MSSSNKAGIEPGHARRTSVSPRGSRQSQCLHDVQFYVDDHFLTRSISSFVCAELQRGGVAVVVATSPHRESLAEELGRSGVNLPAAVDQGRYIALDAAETLAQFLVDGRPDETPFRDLVGNILSCAAAVAGCNGGHVVVFGEMVTLLWQRNEAEAALLLEQYWNRLAQAHTFHLRCGYPITSFDRDVHSELFSQICSEHHVVIPAEGYTGLSDERERLRTVARLQQREQALRTESVERRNAQEQAREAQSQNQQLADEIRKRETLEDELRSFTRRLLSARDEEQRRIAAELHENTAQLLAALSLYFGVLHEEKASLNPRVASIVASSRSVSDSLLGEISKLSRLLHPPTLDDIGLGSALREYLDQLTASSGAKIQLEIPDDLGRFNRDFEIAVFRIVEEAVTNVCPQPCGELATVSLSRTPAMLVVEVQSHQFNSTPDTVPGRSKTRIMGIHERVMERGGAVQFTSDPSGTLLRVTLPLQESGGQMKSA